MEITEVRIKLMEDPGERLKGFCSITFERSFVIRDLKIIQGGKGPFVAMPSRKLTDRCPECGNKNHLRARFCNDCGAELEEDRAAKDDEGRAKLYADIAHPINSSCRELIQRRVLEAFEREKILAQQPGYVCNYDDYGEDRIARLKHRPEQELAGPDSGRPAASRTGTTSSGGHFRIDLPHAADSAQTEAPAPAKEAPRPHHLDQPDTPSKSPAAEHRSGPEQFGEGIR